MPFPIMNYYYLGYLQMEVVNKWICDISLKNMRILSANSSIYKKTFFKTRTTKKERNTKISTLPNHSWINLKTLNETLLMFVFSYEEVCRFFRTINNVMRKSNNADDNAKYRTDQAENTRCYCLHNAVDIFILNCI